jgi:transposase
MRYHGVDLHKRYATVSVRDESGAQKAFMGREYDIGGYVGRLTAEDVVALEASSGALYWAQRIGEQGARCVVIDAYRFRIIRDSWQKTDRHDATNLSLALWLAETTGQVKLPVVWQPSATVRELRRLTGMYEILNKQIRQLKNLVQGVLLDNGVRERAVGNRLVEYPGRSDELLASLSLTPASRFCVQMALRQLVALAQEKEALQRRLYWTGRPLEADIRLLMGIRGVTPLLALVFLSEVGDIRRFSSARKMHAYLGVVPSTRSSGGKTRNGAITRASRHLPRTLFTQVVPHLANSSPSMARFYLELAGRKGHGRARIALLRKIFSVMRRMLLEGEQYRGVEPTLYARKIRLYQNELKKMEAEQEAA